MKRKKYTEKLLLSLDKEINDDLHKYCDKYNIEVSSTIRKAIRKYIDDPLQNLKEGVKNEPIVEAPFEIPKEYKNDKLVPIRFTVPQKLQFEINVFRKMVRLNFDAFCVRSIQLYINKLKGGKNDK